MVMILFISSDTQHSVPAMSVATKKSIRSKGSALTHLCRELGLNFRWKLRQVEPRWQPGRRRFRALFR